MKNALTGSLVVCVAAAGIAVGALALEPGTPAAPAAPGVAPQAPADSPYGEGGATGAPAAATVDIGNFTFSAPVVAPGATVTVTNRDPHPHTVTGDDGSFQSQTVEAGATGTFVAPSVPGTYTFHCDFHPQMSGTLTVG